MILTDEEIEEIVEGMIEDLPAEFKDALKNVIIAVEDAPDPKKPPQRRVGKSQILLGLYHGVPKTHRSERYGPVMPDYIAIYRKSIERVARSKTEAKQILRQTLLHEIGHHLGLSEYDLRARGF